MRFPALLATLALSASPTLSFANEKKTKAKIVKTSFPLSPTLIGGRPAPAGEFPASVYASMNGSACSATVVGPRVLFIAAHCVDNGATASFTVGPNQYNSKCTHSADYRGNATADYALCLIDRDVVGIKYESVATDVASVRLNQELLLTGYGCVRDGGGGGNDGVYRIGESIVRGLPNGADNDITVRGGAALCFGDSGGPAFSYLDAAKTKRILVSINSRGQIRGGGESYLSAVYTTQAKRFIASWQGVNKQNICGVNADTPSCRGIIEPPPPPEEDKCKDEVEAMAKVKVDLDDKFKAVVDCVSK